jgi:hypothetical protein
MIAPIHPKTAGLKDISLLTNTVPSRGVAVASELSKQVE